MKLGIAEILEQTSKLKSTDDKIEYLRRNWSPALGTVLKYAYDPSIKWLLPSGIPPFKTNPFVDQQSTLYAEARRLYLFIEGGNPNLTKVKRELLFIQFLENLDPADANLMVHVKDKKIPYKGITSKLIQQAFPGLLPEKERQQSEQAIS